jgi:SAM-dependent methyltransferase
MSVGLVWKPVIDSENPHLGGNMEGGDPRSYVPEVWALLKEKLEPKTVYDVGCGEGEAMAWFAQAGCHAYGVDGLQCNTNAAQKHGRCLTHDFVNGPAILLGVDLVWCQEVVEHIDRAYLLNLIQTITCGRFLAMTHAVPGQGGHHHVNEQHGSYWVDVLRVAGMSLLPELTEETRRAAGPGKFWHYTGLVFEKAK